MIGIKISPILKEIEDTLWEFENYSGEKPGYTPDGFRASIKIFMSALMDKMWELQDDESITMKSREDMAESAGNAVRSLVLTYTGIDTKKLYE